MTDRPPAERADRPRSFGACVGCLDEIDALRAQVATLTAERDAARAESDSEREASRAAWRLLRDPDMGGRRFAEAVRILEAAAIRARGAK